MIRAVVGGTTSAIDVIKIGDMGINRHQIPLIHQAAISWWEARFSDVMFRLSLSLSLYISFRPSGVEVMDGTSNINCQQPDRLPYWLSHPQFGFSPASRLCICVYALRIQSWLKKIGAPHPRPVSRVIQDSPGATDMPATSLVVHHLQCRGWFFTSDVARLARSLTLVSPNFCANRWKRRRRAWEPGVSAANQVSSVHRC